MSKNTLTIQPHLDTPNTLSIPPKSASSTRSSQSHSPHPAPVPVELPFFKSSPEMSQIASLSYTLTSKFYNCGFVYKLNALSATGTPLPPDQSGSECWTKYWMEIWGSVLLLWRVPDELASFGYTAGLAIPRSITNEIDPSPELMGAIKGFQTPVVVNFSDAVIEIFKKAVQGDAQNPAPPTPYTSFFGLSTASSNLYLFASASNIQANQWICSIRLSMYELKRINLLFTKRLLQKPTMAGTWKEFGMGPFESGYFRGELRYEGPLQVRLPFSNVWRQFHVVVTSKAGADAYVSTQPGISSKLFGKRDSLVLDTKRGTLLFYESKSSVDKGKTPSFIMTDVIDVYDIWPENADEKSIQSVSLAKVEGTFKFVDGFTSESVVRSFSTFAAGFPDVKSLEQFEHIITGIDTRPLPTDLLIMAPSGYALSKWIVSILGSFSIDSIAVSLDDEIKEMTRMPEVEEGVILPSLVQVEWPTQMYLSVDEVGGITMPNNSTLETYILFSHYLAQKVTLSKQNQIKLWNQEVSKGHWERGLQDRKEMESRYKALQDWVDKVGIELQKHGIATAKPSPTLLASAMSTIVPWLGPVLASMMDPILIPIVAAAETVSTLSDSGSVLIADREKKDASALSVSSSEENGSVSSKDRSSEGSLSDEEVSPVATIPQVFRIIYNIR